jgi:hypothetical protein
MSYWILIILTNEYFIDLGRLSLFFYKLIKAKMLKNKIKKPDIDKIPERK